MSQVARSSEIHGIKTFGAQGMTEWSPELPFFHDRLYVYIYIYKSDDSDVVVWVFRCVRTSDQNLGAGQCNKPCSSQEFPAGSSAWLASRSARQAVFLQGIGVLGLPGFMPSTLAISKATMPT